ncbi:SH2 domain-containing protein 2A [Struthio camelus]|uniref:SH2 domain-containing protein 2A n=1 Tax=Struthio camelus TaxID=8801 RepID=UPI0036041B70
MAGRRRRYPLPAADVEVPVALGRGEPAADDRPLLGTFHPVGEDKAPRGSSRAPAQAPRAELPPGCQDAQGRVSPGCRPASPQQELAALQARTRLWFERTQAGRLRAQGELPAWFHGFVSRRETERLLEDEPEGSFLVRFSESTVGFVLSYRGRERCRHFMLEQLADGCYAILGEGSGHVELADLLRHHAAAPVALYGELLTAPCRRAPDVPAKAGSPAAAQGASGPTGKGAAAATTAARASGEPRVRHQPEERIPFYAVGRVSAASAGPEENVYSEVTPLARGAVSPLPAQSRPAAEPARRGLFRSKSSLASERQQLLAAPGAEGRERGARGPATEATTKPSLQLDDPIYSRSMTTPKRAAAAAAGQEVLENIYEQVSGDRL